VQINHQNILNQTILSGDLPRFVSFMNLLVDDKEVKIDKKKEKMNLPSHL